MSEQVFCSVHIKELPTDKPFKYDLYVKLPTDRFLKVSPAGETLSKERLDSYIAKGAKDLYLTQRDYGDYIGLAVPDKSALDEQTRAKLAELRADADATMSMLYTNDMNDFLFESARTTVSGVVELSAMNPTVMDLLKSLKDCSEDGYLYRHGIAVSLFSVMIGKAMNWESTGNLFKVGLGATMHDIGLKSINPKLHQMPYEKMSETEKAEYERHTHLGAQIVAVVSTVPSDVTSIIMEHHENCLGNGFPRKLSKLRIHPMAKVVAVADRFCDLTLAGDAENPQNVIDSAQEVLADERFDPEVLKAFQTLFVAQPSTAESGQQKEPQNAAK